MKDGIRILGQAKKIRHKTNNVIRLYTSAPVCSKKEVFLIKNNILILNFIVIFKRINTIIIRSRIIICWVLLIHIVHT